jgi:hypothetical protein
MAILGKTKIEGNLYWPFLNKFNTTFEPDNKKYSVDIGNLTKQSVKDLEKIGITPRNKKDERENFITAKTKKLLSVKDDNEQAVDLDDIGNGTEAEVLIFAYDTKSFPGPFNGLGGIKVTHLVTYNPDELDMDEEFENPDD